MKTLTQKGVGDVPWVSWPGGHLPLPPLLYQRPFVQDVPSSLAGEAFGLPYFKRLTQNLFQIQTNFDIRERIGKSHSFEEFRDCVLLLKERSDTNLGHTMVLPSLITSFFRFLKYHTGEETFETPEEIQIFNLKVTLIMDVTYSPAHWNPHYSYLHGFVSPMCGLLLTCTLKKWGRSHSVIRNSSAWLFKFPFFSAGNWFHFVVPQFKIVLNLMLIWRQIARHWQYLLMTKLKKFQHKAS